ncbi:hypothetical protein GGD63_005869 [Bradyrhizobium sp. cir1]|nr:hypothetical protein [Bradyrhizobium sp. cir1]
MQHEQAAGSAAIVGDDGSIHAELVRRGGLGFADALHLRSMEGIKLPAALALLLRTNLRGPAEWKGEGLLQCRWPSMLRRMSRMIRPSLLRRMRNYR